MRICLVTRYMDFRNAGLGRVGMEIMKGLVRKGHSVCTVSTNGNSLYSYFFYTLCEIPFRLPKDIDVYHAITPIEGMWLPKNKSVVTFHDLIIVTDPDKLGSGIGYNKLKFLIGRTYNRKVINISKGCKGIVSVSEKTREDLVTHLNVKRERIKVIHSGIREDLMPLNKKDKVFRVGYLGQLDRRKRIDVLISAFRNSKLDELVIGGVGLDEAALREKAGYDRRIKFLGLVPDKDLVDFYNSLDVFVFPTMAEGYGLPIVEAMACRKPVVVLSDAIIPNEVKRRCMIVDSLGYVLGNRDYLERLCRSINIEDNYKWAKAHSWDKCAEEYIKVYEEVLER